MKNMSKHLKRWIACMLVVAMTLVDSGVAALADEVAVPGTETQVESPAVAEAPPAEQPPAPEIPAEPAQAAEQPAAAPAEQPEVQQEQAPVEAAEEVTDAEEISEKTEETEEEQEEEKELQKEFTYEDASMIVTATLSETAVLPEGAQLTVRRKELSQKQEDMIEDQLPEGETILGSVTYDVHFEVEGKETEPENGTVHVVFNFKEAIALADKKEGASNGEYVVYHFDESGADLKVEDVPKVVDGDDAGKISSVAFTTDSFSDYSFVYKGQTYEIESTDTFENLVPGGYKLQNFLNGYQVLVFDSMSTTTHFMGAALIRNNFNPNKESFADGRNLPPSYIGGTWSGSKYCHRGDAVGNGDLYLGSGELTAQVKNDELQYTLDGRSIDTNKKDVKIYKNKPRLFTAVL